MRKIEFQRMKIIEKEEEMNELEIDDFFLYGKNVIAQKQNKQVGKPISYYKVISKSETGGVEYTPVFDMLEED